MEQAVEVEISVGWVRWKVELPVVPAIHVKRECSRHGNSNCLCQQQARAACVQRKRQPARHVLNASR